MNKHITLRDWAPQERPRERLLADGVSALSNAELLAITLRTGSKNCDAFATAHQLIGQFGSLTKLFNASQSEMETISGIGPARYAQFQAALELVRRSLYEKLRHDGHIHGPKDTQEFLASKLQGQEREVFACLYMDTQNRVVKYEELFYGTLDSASVHPREVVKNALFHNAAALILAHNHPSGDVRASQADIRITKKLQQALELIGVRVLDHFIVGKGKCYSFSSEGLL